MKIKSIKTVIIGLLLGSLNACSDYLDVSDELSGGLSTFEQVFSNVDYTKRWYANVYANVPNYSRFCNPNGMGGIWSAYADEVYNRWANNSGRYNDWNATNNNSERWVEMYQRIRQANIFMEKARPIMEEGGPNAARLTQVEVDRYKANVRFMRALYHFYLMELNGPIPIITQSFTLEDDLDIPRNSLDEVINFIDTELREAMEGMEQEPYHDNESFRAVPTKGVALAVLAKLWMYAASPLYNGEYTEALQLQNKDGKYLFPAKDENKKQKAFDACKAFIDYAEENNRYELYKVMVNGVLDPDQSVYGVFQEYNKEIIWATSVNSWGGADGNDYDTFTTPRSESKGLGDIAVVQELVDDFYMKDGLPIKNTSFLTGSPLYSETGFGTYNGIEVFNMYIDREPRFYNTITFSGKRWHISNKEVQFYRGGNADNRVEGSPRTGYLLYKRVNRTVHMDSPGVRSKFRPSIIFRLADFYLLYAEALNEVNPSDPDVLEYVNRVRERAGLPKLEDLNPAIKGNQDLQREAIRRERRIELATEGQRYFDVRRWMIAENAPGEGGQGGNFHGMNMYGNKTTFHTRTVIHNRSFKRKNYFDPIPYAAIQKSEQLVQNPGW
ncbi:MAG: RagB/SusD family nutrient uptake outer membrane protein [Proteiniphilum sp.]|uniref:RagB/SusD family nutrient uptake outer membrane protein n=1 Tax=Proteiniphilum sp. TaxID=1926877 RepID=UPI002AB9CCC6|nr:RagB/SusD family nutrient uptake outer membrane protein [Proteiniphilum sp.]MDY9917547.1 RagB/SusD family nutrient uptake outer membrane protein [Proteiniphilum sp.]